MPTLTLVRNDANFYIEFTVKDSEGDVVNITNYTPVFKVQKYGQSTLTFEITGTVTDGTNGVFQVKISDELSNLSGEFIGEVQFSHGSTIITAPDISLKILEDLPRA